MFLIEFLEASEGVLLEHAYIVVVKDAEGVDEVMRDAGELFGSRLGGADVHFAVELAAVGREDFHAEGFGEADGEFRLPHGGGAGQYEQFFHGSKFGIFYECIGCNGSLSFEMAICPKFSGYLILLLFFVNLGLIAKWHKINDTI